MSVEEFTSALPNLGEFVQRKRIELGASQRNLAQMVRISEGYVRRIERNAYDGKLGDSVFEQLAKVLKLTADERVYLALLGGVQDRAPYRNERADDDTVAQVLKALSPHAAARYTNWTVTAANDAFRLLWPGLAEAPSLLEWLFGDPRARLVIPDWDVESAGTTAAFRGYAADPDPVRRQTATELLRRLWHYDEFRRLWESGAVQYSRHGRIRRSALFGEEITLREILLPWPQRGADAFEVLFVGLLMAETKDWLVQFLLKNPAMWPF